MSNRILNLVFKADTAAAKSALKDLEGTEGQPGGVAGLSLALSKAQLLWSAYGTAAVLAGKQIGEEIDKYTDYVGRVEELRDGLNLSAEDASYLTGMMEEHGISVSTLMNIFEDLSEKGIDPSVQSLMDVMTELDKYPEGSERTSKAMDALGKEGIGPLMDWWSDLTQEQRDNIDLLRGEYTEVTNEVITETGEFDAAVGDLRTEWIGFKNDILVEIIPALTKLIGFLNTGITKGDEMRASVDRAIAAGGITGGQQALGVQAGIDVTASKPNLLSAPVRRIGHAAGGAFTVGGAGGSDTTPVSFMATPGETVSIGGGTSDMENILSEVRRLVDSLPTLISDAVERG